MADDQQANDGFTDGQTNGLNQHRIDHDRTLIAVHALESALAQPAPPRQGQWLIGVIHALDTLEDAMRTEAENAARPDSLLSDIAFNQPRLRNRVRGLRVDYRRLQQAISVLRAELTADRPIAFTEIRHRLPQLLSALRHQRARESDLIYEAYYEAFQTDLAGDTARSIN